MFRSHINGGKVYLDGKYLGEVSGMEIKHGDEKQTWETGAQRDSQEGKGRFDLIEPSFLFKVAGVNEGGAKHYGDRNYRKGIPLNRYVDSAIRHLLRWVRGDRDEPHLAQAAWNVEKLDWTADEILAGRLPRSLDPHGYLDGDFNKLTGEQDESVDCRCGCQGCTKVEGCFGAADPVTDIYVNQDRGTITSVTVKKIEEQEEEKPEGQGIPVAYQTADLFAQFFGRGEPEKEEAKPPYLQTLEEMTASFREGSDAVGRIRDAQDQAYILLLHGPMPLLDYYRDMKKAGFDAWTALEARQRLDTVVWSDPRPWIIKSWVGYKQDVPDGVKEVGS